MSTTAVVTSVKMSSCTVASAICAQLPRVSANESLMIHNGKVVMATLFFPDH